MISATVPTDLNTSTTREMWIPTKLYEMLPSIYCAVGTAMISGAIYIGVDHGPMIGYLIVGALCISAGIVVSSIRHRARSERQLSRT